MPDEHNPHSAREAAEALFKPQKQPPASKPDNTQTDISAAVDYQTVRELRILPIKQPQQECEPEQPTDSKPQKSLRPSQSLNVDQIKKSEHGRIRALATYGMRVAQVAEAYGVVESEIELIVVAKV